MAPSATSTAIPSQYFDAPATIWGLESNLKAGLHAMGVVAVLSAASTFGLLCFITYRMVFWRRYYNSAVSYNQNVLLVYNLLLGDLFQSISFLFSFYWIKVDGILAPTSACSAQGALLHFGDVSSGTFVFLISVHTAASVLWGRTAPHRVLVGGIVCCWIFAIVITLLGPAIYGGNFFTSTGAWCWENRNYETARLWSHYVWIFIFEFGTLIIYLTTFILLRKRIISSRPTMMNQPHSSNGSRASHFGNRVSVANPVSARVNRATFYMIVYPVTYVLCTAPLAIGRMYTMSTGNDNPTGFYILAGCLLTSCGWIDAVVYTITRRVLVNTDSGDYRARGPSSSARDSRGPIGGTYSARKHNSPTLTRPSDEDFFEVELRGVVPHPSKKPSMREKTLPTAPTAVTTTITGGVAHDQVRSNETSPEESERESISRTGSTDHIFNRVRADTKVEITVEDRIR